MHGVGGIVGGILTGLFAQEEIGGTDGAFYGNGEQLGRQLAGILMTSVYSAVGTAVIMLGLKVTIGIRVSEEDEDMGLDVSEHGDTAGNSAPMSRTASSEGNHRVESDSADVPNQNVPSMVHGAV